MSDQVKIGHPKKGEVREKLTQVLFKADKETIDNLRELEAAATDIVKGRRRSVIIRRAIREARERLQK